MHEDAKDLLFAVGLSIIFIYLLMAFLFESFVLPLSIVLTIPLAFLGVAWGHMVSGLDLDFLGMVGIVLLIGVVVNNGIVLIDYVIRLRHAGARARRGARRRHPPPLPADHDDGARRRSSAWCRCCSPAAPRSASRTPASLSRWSAGITVATLLTLLAVPVFYTLFDDLRAHLGQTLAWGAARAARRGSKTAEPASA